MKCRRKKEEKKEIREKEENEFFKIKVIDRKIPPDLFSQSSSYIVSERIYLFF